MKLSARWLALAAMCAVVSTGYSATFEFRNNDGPGEGLNDASPVTPEGGNTATTLGQARLNVLTEAGRIWGTLLTSSIPIIVDVTVDPLTCTPSSATLAQAGPTFSYRDFAGAPLPNVFYPSALADALTGTNVSEGSSTSAGSADLRVTVNLTLNNTAGCFGGLGFYYGFDHNNTGGRPDLLQVLLHEIAHGLGFTSRVDPNTGIGSVGTDGIERFNSFDQLIFDEQLNLPWVSLTDAQRIQSATRTGLLAWNGANVNKWGYRFSAGTTANGRFRLYAPASVAVGSSVSHFDTVVTPNVLMEPNRNNTTNSFTDITTCALKDMGWTVARCIDAANSAPVAQDQAVTVPEDTPVSITLTGTDAENDPLSYALVVATSRGALSNLSVNSPRTVTFTPTPNANGVDNFTFTVNDGISTSATGQVTINITPVNDAPVAAPLQAVVQSAQSVNITLSGTDIDGDALTYAIVAGPTSGTLTGTPPNVAYRSNSGFTGTDSFTYRANDAALPSATVTVSITVTAPPAPPPSSGGGGGGGGAMQWQVLALLAGLLLHSCVRNRTDGERRKLGT